jgi:hypothetical protein
VSHLSQSIHNYPNGIVSRLSSFQTHNKIYDNFFPCPLRHLQWLQQSSRLMMFSLDSLISVSKSNILGNVSLHSIPPIGGLEIMVHLIPSWINGISILMCLTKYLILQFHFLLIQSSQLDELLGTVDLCLALTQSVHTKNDINAIRFQDYKVGDKVYPPYCKIYLRA